MKKQEWANWILETLEFYFPNPKIPLLHDDPYTLLIAVLLSAQCTDERVNQVTPHLFKLANNPFAMAKLDIETIEKIIQPCGLFRGKAKAIKNLSIQLVNQFDGKVPCDMTSLELLPGVGHKTASVVMIQAFNEPAFPVDTHIHRLSVRWKLSNGKNVSQSEKDLKKWFKKESWAKLHLQMIFYGRSYCKARGHDETKCPICLELQKRLS